MISGPVNCLFSLVMFCDCWYMSSARQLNAAAKQPCQLATDKGNRLVRSCNDADLLTGTSAHFCLSRSVKNLTASSFIVGLAAYINHVIMTALHSRCGHYIFALASQLISTGFAFWQRYCTALQQWASAKLCGVEQRAPPIYSAGRPSRWALAHILVNSAYVYGLPPTSVKCSTIKQPHKAVTQYDSVQRHTLGRRNTVQQYGIANKTMQQCSLFTLTGKNMNMTEHDRKTRVVNLRLGSVVCYYTTLSVIQGSAVADKPARSAASRQTAIKTVT